MPAAARLCVQWAATAPLSVTRRRPDHDMASLAQRTSMSAESNGKIPTASVSATAQGLTMGLLQAVDALDTRIRASGKLLLDATLCAFCRGLLRALQESRRRRATTVLRECAHLLPLCSGGDEHV